MMKNKLNGVMLIIAITLSTVISGCKKYEDGPAISLRTRTTRLAQTWKIDNYKVNGTDLTSLLADYNETYSKDGGFSYSWSILNGAGTWKFQNRDKEVKITGGDNLEDMVLFIQKLEMKSFWYYYMDGNDKKEFHMVVK